MSDYDPAPDGAEGAADAVRPGQDNIRHRRRFAAARRWHRKAVASSRELLPSDPFGRLSSLGSLALRPAAAPRPRFLTFPPRFLKFWEWF